MFDILILLQTVEVILLRQGRALASGDRTAHEASHGDWELMYSLAALADARRGVLLLIRRGQSEPARNAAVAAIVSAGWAALMFSQAPPDAWPTWNAMMADGFRLGAWLIALQALASVEFPRWLRRMSLGLCVALIVYTSVGAHLADHRRRPADADRCRGRLHHRAGGARRDACTCGARR